MRLISLQLRNFKGIKSFDLVPDGANVSVFGDNGTGKTTLADSFMWLLYDKDSSNRKDFGIKTLDPKTGEPRHGLEHSVEAELEVDGRRIVLKKVYAENWTKQRGSAKKQFTGHSTAYYIDGVPVKRAEYVGRVAALLDEGISRLLSDPMYFNQQLHWQKRRELLLAVCGNVSDQDVIESNPDLAKLPGILGDRSLDDHRKMVAAERTRINKELEKIPVRIDEVTRGLPELPEASRELLGAQLANLRDVRTNKDTERNRLESGGEIAEQQKRLAEIAGELLEIKNQYRARVDMDIEGQKARFAEIYDQVRGLKSAIREANREINSNQERIARLNKTMESLRERWHQHNALTFEHTADCVCPTCGQDIPQEQLDAAREKALAEFNTSKARKLEEIAAEGKAAKAEADELKDRNTELETEIRDAEQEVARLEKVAAEIQDAINLLQEAAGEYTTDPAYQAKMQERDTLQAEIDKLKAGNTDAMEQITAEIETLDQEITILQGRLAKIDQYERGQKRIKELGAEERRLAVEFEDLEKQVYLTEEFIRSKVKLLNEKINSRFQLARFKLFDVQVNGGVVEVCETTFNGVPYSDLNHGARLNVGIDIINTLADHYGFAPPVFVDNAESVTSILAARGQMIKLVVSERDKKLRVEHESKASERMVV